MYALVTSCLSVCAGCEVSRSCFITILNKLPNLTALNYDRIKLPVNEWEVSMHNAQMQCSCVCSDTASTACFYVHSLVEQRSQEGSCPSIMQFPSGHHVCVELFLYTRHTQCANACLAPQPCSILWIWKISNNREGIRKKCEYKFSKLMMYIEWYML